MSEVTQIIKRVTPVSVATSVVATLGTLVLVNTIRLNFGFDVVDALTVQFRH